MTKHKNEPTDLSPTDLSNEHQADAPQLKGAQGNGGTQMGAFRELARRIHTELSAQRFEAALRALLLPMKRLRRETTVQPPTHNPES